MSVRAAVFLPLPALLLASAVACGGEAAGALADMDDAPLETLDDVATWGLTSPPMIFVIGYDPVLAFEEGDLDQACPTVTLEDDRIVWEGGCVTDRGLRYEGRLVFEQSDLVRLGDDALRVGTLTWDGFGLVDPEAWCPYGEGTAETRAAWRGRMQVVRTADDRLEFDVDLVTERFDFPVGECEPVLDVLAFDYAGSIGWAPAGSTWRTTWEGAGRMGDSRLGRVAAETADEILDATVCAREPASGRTVIETEAHRAVLTYDGASDCDDDATAQVELDGEALGELTGVSCAAAGGGAPGGAVGSTGLLLVLAAGLLGARRRRR